MSLYLSVFDWIFIAGLCVAVIIVAIDSGMKRSKPLRARFAIVLNSRIWAFAPLALVVVALSVATAGHLGWLGVRAVSFPRWPYPYQPERIVGKKFANERVVLDGRSFLDCDFTNVTMVYNGTTAIQLRGNRLHGAIRYDTDNPAVVGTILMLHAMKDLRPDFKLDIPAARIEGATRAEKRAR
jgi:hypothetical protein